jgi:4-amino-4-deoxy-L-arabinose transferase-like glycosyltransferase
VKNRHLQIRDWQWILAIATVLRLFRLGWEQLWFDEAFSVWTISPYSNLMQGVIGDNHPPFWYLIEAIFTRIFGLSVFTLRFPALLFSLGCVWLIWQIAKTLFGRPIGFTAGLIAALLPASLYCGQDCRMYAALSFFVLLMVYASLKKNNVVLVLAGIGAVYTHNVGVIYVLAIAWMYALSSGSWRMLWPGCLIALAWLPWASVVVAQADRVSSGFWVAPISLGGALYPGVLATLGWRMAEGIEIPVVAVVIALSMLTAWTIRSWMHLPAVWTVVAGAVVAPVLLLLFSLTVIDVWVFRALFPAGLLLCVLWAYTLHKLSQPIAGYMRLLFEFALLIGVLSHYFPVATRPDVEAWNAPIKANWQTGDLIYYLNTNDTISNGLYIDRPFAIRPTPANLLNVTRECRIAFGLLTAEQELPSLAATRLWVSYIPTPYTPQSEIDFLSDLLNRHPFQIVERAGNAVLYRIDLQ